MKVLVVIMVLCLGLMACSQNSRKGSDRQGNPVPVNTTVDINSHEGHDHEMPGDTAAAAPAATDPASPHVAGVGAVEPDAVSPEVAAVYSGVILKLVDVNTHEASTMDVPFGETVAIEGTNLSITVSSFFPDFVMTETCYGTRTMDQNNPGAKVTVTGGEQEFSGWIFKLYPDMHPFENPNYDVILEGGILK
jgi:hypothetical protein